MLDGKLRIAPTCYHMLHQVPVRAAHEMNFFYDEGLKTAHGSLAYELLTDSMVPFGLEKLGISQAMKEKSVDIALDVQSRTVFYQRINAGETVGRNVRAPPLNDVTVGVVMRRLDQRDPESARPHGKPIPRLKVASPICLPPPIVQARRLFCN